MTRYKDHEAIFAGENVLTTLMGIAASQGQRLYVGEFGEPGGDVSCNGTIVDRCGGDPQLAVNRRVLQDHAKGPHAHAPADLDQLGVLQAIDHAAARIETAEQELERLLMQHS